jgi:uncharacterized membrane-anchored protein
MSTGWTLVLLAMTTVIALVLMSWRRRGDIAELGTVSARWIANHRATEPHYAER